MRATLKSIALVTLFVFAISIYFALYGDEFGILRFRYDSPENITGAVISVKSPFNDSVYKYRIATSSNLSFAKDVNRSYLLHDDSCPHADSFLLSLSRLSSVTSSLESIGIKFKFIGSLRGQLFDPLGCDASLLLDAHESSASEKDASPNLYLKGFYAIDYIKYQLEDVCPGVVSCSDILALAAREAVLLAGGPLYLLKTGRRDSVIAFKDIAERELPSPQASLLEILARFASRGFNERETVSLFGAISLYNFSGTSKPDPQLNPGLLQALRTKLMSREETEIWVRAYASDQKLFHYDFDTSMVKLSGYQVLTGPIGQVRIVCSRVLP